MAILEGTNDRGWSLSYRLKKKKSEKLWHDPQITRLQSNIRKARTQNQSSFFPPMLCNRLHAVRRGHFAIPQTMEALIYFWSCERLPGLYYTLYLPSYSLIDVPILKNGNSTVVLNQGWFCPLGDIWQCLQTFLIVTLQGTLLVSSA